MDSLRPFSWDQLATKDDFNAPSTSITAKFDQADAQFTAVAAEFVSLRGEISKEVAGPSTKIGGLDNKIEHLHSSVSKKITEQTRTMVLMMAGFAVAVCTAMARRHPLRLTAEPGSGERFESLVYQAGLKLTPPMTGMSSPPCSSWT